MTYRIGTRLLAFGLMAVGLVGLATVDDLAAASKTKDAQKCIQTLRTSQDPDTVADALEELGELGQVYKPLATPAMPEIMAALKNSNAKVRAAAAKALGMIDPDPADAVPALTKLLNDDSDEMVKIAAINGLGSMGKEAKPALKDLRTLYSTDEEKKSKLGRAARDAMRSINRRDGE